MLHRGPVRTIISWSFPNSTQTQPIQRSNGRRYPRLYSALPLYHSTNSEGTKGLEGTRKVSGKDYISRANQLVVIWAHPSAYELPQLTAHSSQLAPCSLVLTPQHSTTYAPAPALARHSRITQPDSKRGAARSPARLHKTVPRAPAFEVRRCRGKKKFNDFLLINPLLSATTSLRFPRIWI